MKLLNNFATKNETDKTKVDTDEDGITDFIEIANYGYNPLDSDNDNNGERNKDKTFYHAI